MPHFLPQSYEDQAEHLRRLADRLESNSLLSTITILTEQLQKSVTDKTTTKWLTDKQEEITAHRSELINTIRQAAEIWTEAAQHVHLYEKGCLSAQDCITGETRFFIKLGSSIKTYEIKPLTSGVS